MSGVFTPVLATVFEEDDLHTLRQIWHAFDAISALASRPMEANLGTIHALSEIAMRQLGQLLDEKPLGSGWEPYLDDIPEDIPRDDPYMDEWLAAMDTPQQDVIAASIPVPSFDEVFADAGETSFEDLYEPVPPGIDVRRRTKHGQRKGGRS